MSGDIKLEQLVLNLLQEWSMLLNNVSRMLGDSKNLNKELLGLQMECASRTFKLYRFYGHSLKLRTPKELEEDEVILEKCYISRFKRYLKKGKKCEN